MREAGRHRRRSRSLVGTLFAAFVLFQLFPPLGGSPERSEAQLSTLPNIVLILTDDQRADSLAKMPIVQRSLVQRGMRFDAGIVSNPICCPSRAAILTGRYSHSNTVYTNGPPFGGWSTFHGSGAEATTIATALDAVGYRTGLFGKYMNLYSEAGAYVPPGWDRWFALASPASSYYDYTIYDDRRGFLAFGSRPQDYLTDVLRRQAHAFVEGTPADTPLFLMVTPYAPHIPRIPAPRHVGTLAGSHVRLGPAVNEADVSDKPEHIRRLRTRSRELARNQVIRQWESLLAVDELVGDLVSTLKREGRMHNTVFIYTSDNGLSFFEHRWRGKQVPYEESIRVPFVIRFDGEVPPATASEALVANVDIAPTIADLAGADLASVDGVSIRPLIDGTATSVRDSVLLEFVPLGSVVPAYCGVRTTSFLFVRYATGEEELYDLVHDPAQLVNVAERRPRKAESLRNVTMSLCRPTPPGFSW